jgi:hypothetical protein
MMNDLPEIVKQAEISAAIEAIEQFTNCLTDEGFDKLFDIRKRLITELEDKK